MKLDLTINGREEQIEILASEPACRFRLGRRGRARGECGVSAELACFPCCSMARSYDAYVEETPAGVVVVVIDGYRFEIEARDPRRWSRKSAGRGGDAVQSIVSPMPGKVVRVLVAAGDAVEAGPGHRRGGSDEDAERNEGRARGHGAHASPQRKARRWQPGELLATIE